MAQLDPSTIRWREPDHKRDTNEIVISIWDRINMLYDNHQYLIPGQPSLRV